MRYIIMAGGVYEVFEHIFKKPRPLIEINGEPIVERTIRLLKKLGIDDIMISLNKGEERYDYLLEKYNIDKIQKYDSYVAHMSHSDGSWYDCFFNPYMPVTYLNGDTWYSEEALKYIIDYPVEDYKLFIVGTADKKFPKGYFKKWSEPLAHKVIDYENFFKAVELMKRYEMKSPEVFEHKQAVWYQLYQYFAGIPLTRFMPWHKYSVIVPYFGVDIDKPEDVSRLEEAIKEYKIK